MALANIFGWNRQVQPAEQRVERQKSPQKSPQLVAQLAEQQTSLRRNQQPVAQHVALPISK